MKKMVFAFSLVLGAAAFGAVEISDVLVRQRWPWDGKVDIVYTVKGAERPVDIQVSATNAGAAIAVPNASLSGEWLSVGSGTHVLTWDPAVGAAEGTVKYDALEVNLTPTMEKLYMIVDLGSTTLEKTAAARVSYTNEVIGTGTDAAGNRAWDDEYKTDKLVLRRCLAGSFLCGSPSTEPGRNSANEIRRQIKISRPFYIGVFEFTQKQTYHLFGSYWQCYFNDAGRDVRPLDNTQYNHIDIGGNWPNNMDVSYNLLGKLRDMVGKQILFHMPTEAEWEYACRAGTTTMCYNGDYTTATFYSSMAEVGNIGQAALAAKDTPAETGGTKPVGSYKPNPWGLYDMIGNVAEWTRDWFAADWGVGSARYLVDPAPLATGDKKRVLRGGPYTFANTNDKNYYTTSFCRTAGRMASLYNQMNLVKEGMVGFRVWAPVD